MQLNDYLSQKEKKREGESETCYHHKDTTTQTKRSVGFQGCKSQQKGVRDFIRGDKDFFFFPLCVNSLVDEVDCLCF